MGNGVRGGSNIQVDASAGGHGEIELTWCVSRAERVTRTLNMENGT
jgi:hypothetical protein